MAGQELGALAAEREREGARLAATEFSWDAIAARTEGVYERVVTAA